MKTYKFFAIAMAAVATASCTKEIAQNNAPEENLNLSPLTLTAYNGEEDTKAAFSETKYPVIEWKADDAISLLGDGTGNQQFVAKASGKSVQFEGLADLSDILYYAVYPYDAAITLSEGTLSNVTVPAVQTATAGSFDPKAYVAVAECADKSTLAFKSAVAFLKFQVADAANVKKVMIVTNGTETMAGTAAAVTYNSGSIVHGSVSSATASKSITVEGTFEDGKDYFAIVRPQPYASGITIYVQYKDGTVKSGTTSSQLFESGQSRNHIKSLGTLAPTTVVTDLYEMYNIGLDIEIAGETVNKANFGAANLVEAAGTLKDGVNFINPDVDGVVFGNHTSLIAVGRYLSQRSKISKSAFIYLAATDKKDNFLLRNLEISLTSAGAYLIAPNQNDKVFETIGFDNCAIEIPSDKNLIYSSSSTRAIDNVALVNCDVKINATSSASERYLVKCSNTSMSHVAFENNLIYSTSNITNFAMLSNASAVVGTLAVNRNSIVNLYPKVSSSYCITSDATEVSGSNNIFYIPDYESLIQNAEKKVQYTGIVTESTYTGYGENFKTNYAIYGAARPTGAKLKCGYGSNDGTIYSRSKAESIDEEVMDYSTDYFDLENGVFKTKNASYGAQR
ncbi:MAG: hypothetical protein ACI3ZS_06230 [Candidatus Cryptobacteroides sp.]